MAAKVVVVSKIRDLAGHVRRILPDVYVEDAHYQPGRGVSAEMLGTLKGSEVQLCDGEALLWCLNNNAAPQLKWAQCTWAGIDFVMKELNFVKPAQDFHLTRTGEGFGSLMAEYVTGHIVARERGFFGLMERQQQKVWAQSEFIDFRPLDNLTIGILGFGAIGKEVARYCKFMGMNVWAVSRTAGKAPCPDVDEFRVIEDLPEVLSNCDYLCNILPSTPATRDLLSGDTLKHCQKKKSVLINIGRGSVVSDDSLVQAIQQGWLGGAVLDVFNTEPLPADSPLWSLPGVIITPHISGPSLGDRVAKAFADNYKLYTAGQPLQYLVDWDRGY